MYCIKEKDNISKTGNTQQSSYYKKTTIELAKRPKKSPQQKNTVYLNIWKWQK